MSDALCLHRHRERYARVYGNGTRCLDCGVNALPDDPSVPWAAGEPAEDGECSVQSPDFALDLLLRSSADTLPGQAHAHIDEVLDTPVSPIAAAHFGAAMTPPEPGFAEVQRAVVAAHEAHTRLTEIRAIAHAKGVFWTPGLGFTVGRHEDMPPAPCLFRAHKDGGCISTVLYEGTPEPPLPGKPGRAEWEKRPRSTWWHVPFPESFTPLSVLRAFEYLGLRPDEIDEITWSVS